VFIGVIVAIVGACVLAALSAFYCCCYNTKKKDGQNRGSLMDLELQEEQRLQGAERPAAVEEAKTTGDIPIVDSVQTGQSDEVGSLPAAHSNAHDLNTWQATAAMQMSRGFDTKSQTVAHEHTPASTKVFPETMIRDCNM